MPADLRIGTSFTAVAFEADDAVPAPLAVEPEDFVPVPDSQQVSFRIFNIGILLTSSHPTRCPSCHPSDASPITRNSRSTDFHSARRLTGRIVA